MTGEDVAEHNNKTSTARGGARTFCKWPIMFPKIFFDLLRASSLNSATGGLVSCATSNT
jgi:hypothetical protein